MTYTVISARHKKTVDGQHGPLQIIAMVLQDGNGPVDCEWATLTTTPVPTEGQQLDGTLEAGQYGMKFKRTPPATFGGGGPRPEDPARAARIMRQHSQDMALRTIEIAVKHGIIDPPVDAKDLFVLIARTADWFDKDANAKGTIA